MIYAIRDRYCECGASPCHRELYGEFVRFQVGSAPPKNKSHQRLIVCLPTLRDLTEGRRTDDPLTAQAAAELAARIREQFAQRCSRAPRAEVGGEDAMTLLIDGDEIALHPDDSTSTGEVLFSISGSVTPRNLIQIAGYLRDHHPDWWGGDIVDDAQDLMEAWRDRQKVEEG